MEAMPLTLKQKLQERAARDALVYRDRLLKDASLKWAMVQYWQCLTVIFGAGGWPLRLFPMRVATAGSRAQREVVNG